jgi:mRNA-degrading endonuclease toxin of MazEF toxin-antitoxin module
MKRGEVVEVDWQFGDLTGSKKRPAVVRSRLAAPQDAGGVRGVRK